MTTRREFLKYTAGLFAIAATPISLHAIGAFDHTGKFVYEHPESADSAIARMAYRAWDESDKSWMDEIPWPTGESKIKFTAMTEPDRRVCRLSIDIRLPKDCHVDPAKQRSHLGLQLLHEEIELMGFEVTPDSLHSEAMEAQIVAFLAEKIDDMTYLVPPFMKETING